MKIKYVQLKANSQFGKFILPYLETHHIDFSDYNEENEDAGIDGMVIFNENQQVIRDIEEIKISFDRNQKPVHNIDINGTLQVAKSNLDLWLERNRCKTVLFVGTDGLVKNPNLERLFSNLK
jgi:hypothetical protein